VSPLVALVTGDAGRQEAVEEYESVVSSFAKFEKSMLGSYGIDVSTLKDAFDQENREYYLQTAQWRIMEPHDVLGEPQAVYQIQINNVTLERSRGFKDVEFSITFPHLYRKDDGTVSRLKDKEVVSVTAVALWFSVDFSAGMCIL